MEALAVNGADTGTERKMLLSREKELTPLSDQIARERRMLPWVPIDKTDTPVGRARWPTCSTAATNAAGAAVLPALPG
jgi:predicted dithiol-disulfide oxidoreductase (DUF899 family)